MGSITSGRHQRERRQTTNEIPSIDIREIDYLSLHPDLWKQSPQHVLGEPIYIKASVNELTIGMKTATTFNILGRASITSSPRHFGGAQPYFLCPEHSCGRRVAILYISSGKQIACRCCSDLSYESQHDNKYIRTLRRAANLDKRLRPLHNYCLPALINQYTCISLPTIR